MKKNFGYINRCLKPWKRRKPVSMIDFNDCRKQSLMPEIIVTLSYSQFYYDFATIKPQMFLEGIPTFEALKYILGFETKVHYSLHNTDEDKSIIKEFYYLCHIEEKHVIDKVLKKHSKVTLINSEGTLRFVRLAMTCFTPENQGFVLANVNKYQIFRAYLYCNQIWTNEQLVYRPFGRYNHLLDFSLKIDIPFSEFKYFKDFRTQLYKSIKFFEYAETDCDFSQILPIFCQENHVINWRNYIQILFSFFESSLHSCVINMTDAPEQVILFLSSFIINGNEHNLSDNMKGQLPNEYRSKFLLKSTLNPNNILILSCDLLVDKLYQNLKFNFGDIAEKNHVVNSKGNLIKQKEINSKLGDTFAEQSILYSVLDLIYSGHKDVFRCKGNDLKSKFAKYGSGAPDYYFRQGSNLIIFENKDVLFPNDLKSHTRLIKQKESITNKLAKHAQYFDKNKRTKIQKEGLGQIFYNVFRIIQTPELFRSFDSNVDEVTTIYPVLITYDKTYSALGVNAFIKKKVPTLKKKIANYYLKKDGIETSWEKYLIKNPVIIDIDTLIIYSQELKEKKLHLLDLLNEYINYTENVFTEICSFYTFMMDQHKIDQMSEDIVKNICGSLEV